VKALNFLLPHIRRVPNALSRNDFAENAAQKLGIESALMRQELKRAAQQRLESVRSARPTTVTETEQILLRALLLPEADSARALAAEQLGAHAEWYVDLPTEALLEVLVNSPPPDNPFEAAPDDVSRGLLASALPTSETEEETTAEKVQSALEALHDRYLDRKTREVQTQMGEAEKRGDQTMRLKLLQELMRLTRERQR
jgi:DNA primase